MKIGIVGCVTLVVLLCSSMPVAFAMAIVGFAGFAANRRTKGGPVDTSVPVLFVFTPEGQMRALFANYACHCTTLGGDFNKVCGDWAGFAQEYLEQAYPGATALVALGCGGRTTGGTDTWELFYLSDPTATGAGKAAEQHATHAAGTSACGSTTSTGGASWLTSVCRRRRSRRFVRAR